jgi:hypothetical protein
MAKLLTASFNYEYAKFWSETAQHPVQEVAASPEAQWLLLFRLASVVQQMQGSSRRARKHKQQQQQQQCDSSGVEQLLLALGLPASMSCSKLVVASTRDKLASLVALLIAVMCQMHAKWQCMPRRQFSGAAAAAAVAASYAAPAGQQQQQQQHQDSNMPFAMLQAHLAQPIAATLVDLYTMLPPGMVGAEKILIGLHQLVLLCFSLHDRGLGAAMSSTDADTAAANAAACAAYEQAHNALVELLLHRLGPAVLRVVRKLEQQQSSSHANSSSSSSAQSAGEGNESAATTADMVITSFGKIVLELLDRGAPQYDAT